MPLQLRKFKEIVIIPKILKPLEHAIYYTLYKHKEIVI